MPLTRAPEAVAVRQSAPLVMFEQHREAVEDLASHKYDLGHASRGSDA